MSPQERVRLMTVLKAIDEIFAEAKAEGGEAGKPTDPLAAYWEEQMERGEEPDLDLTLEDLKAMGRI